MLEIFNCLNYIKQQLSDVEQCQLTARIRSDHLLEIEVYFPVLDYHILHAYSSEELKTSENQEMFTFMFIKKIGCAIEAFKKLQVERDKKVKAHLSSFNRRA